MVKHLIIFLIILTSTFQICLGQIPITGNVKDDEGHNLPGVEVSEKNTENATTTDLDGNYSIVVNDSSAVLCFDFVGMVYREISVDDELVINTILKTYTIYEAWDQKIGIYLNSGVLNNPYGVRIDFKVPFFNTPIGLQSSFDYQTDLSLNQLYAGSFNINHIRLNSRLGLSLMSNIRSVSLEDNYSQDYYAIESKWSVYHLDLIAGFGHIKISDKNQELNLNRSGFIAGLGYGLPRPINVIIIGKVGVYNGLTEYYLDAYRDFKRIKTFVKYYDTKSYSELSIGVGLEWTYLFRYQKFSNMY